MNILTSPLPDCIIWQDKAYKLNTDFRIWLEFERIVLDQDIAPAEKTKLIYNICFDEPPPYGAAAEAITEFYTGGQKRRSGSDGKRIISFEQDAEYIYAAFYTQYGIDLSEAKLHWHKFKALFSGLNEDNMIVRIMHFRSADISEIKDKKLKAFYKKMKRTYRLSGNRHDAAAALEELF